MPTLAVTFQGQISGTYSGSPAIGTAIQRLAHSMQAVLQNGTGANQANRFYAATRTLAASASEELDLAGVLEDIFGEVLTLTKVKGIAVQADGGNTNLVLVGGAASNAWAAMFGDATDVLKVAPGGFFMLTAPDANGLAVTANTGDKLKIANSAGGSSITYTIAIAGVA